LGIGENKNADAEDSFKDQYPKGKFEKLLFMKSE